MLSINDYGPWLKKNSSPEAEDLDIHIEINEIVKK